MGTKPNKISIRVDFPTPVSPEMPIVSPFLILILASLNIKSFFQDT